MAVAAAAHARNASHSRAERQTEGGREGGTSRSRPLALHAIIRPFDALVSHADPPLRLSGVSGFELCEIYVKTTIRATQAENVMTPKLPS